MSVSVWSALGASTHPPDPSLVCLLIVTFSPSARRRVSRMKTVALNRSSGFYGLMYQSVITVPPQGSAETIGMKERVSRVARHR